MAYTIISDPLYKSYQEAWLNAIPQNDNENVPSSLFNGFTGFVISTDIIKALLKNETVKSIVFSFVIDTTNTAKIVLFGINNKDNNPLTDYYMFDNSFKLPLSVSEQDKDKQEVLAPISCKRAIRWQNNWQNYLNNTNGLLPATLFRVFNIEDITKDPRLKNHTYPISEIKSDFPLMVFLAVNKYPDPLSANSTGRDLLSFTLQWTDGNDVICYDISQPCPPCCPACPS